VIITAALPSDFGWFFERTGYSPKHGFKGIKAIDDEGKILGFVGMDAWTPNSVSMHVAVDDPAVGKGRLIPESFRYAFGEDRQVVLGVTPENNRRALALAERLGFVAVYTVKDGWAPGVGLVIQEMRRENCRWLRRKG
jgi:L-amino acid N-acyltransferase YncA